MTPLKKLLPALLPLAFALPAHAQFPPPVGQPGTTAMHKDSSAFVAWATTCTVVRGPMDITAPELGVASTGEADMAVGPAGSNGVVCLGDGGSATLTFHTPIANGPGWDLAVFENSFSDTFLELAFVEVSSDGETFVRFPATSNTQDTLQVGGFGNVDATLINNLAGKYRALYGTPFDLEELADTPGLDIDHITHVRVVDVVGCIQDGYATHDQHGRKVNDPWNTPFASGGFDLDAVGVIHQASTNATTDIAPTVLLGIYPNPTMGRTQIRYTLPEAGTIQLYITDAMGRTVLRNELGYRHAGHHDLRLDLGGSPSGTYFVHLIGRQQLQVAKLVLQHGH